MMRKESSMKTGRSFFMPRIRQRPPAEDNKIFAFLSTGAVLFLLLAMLIWPEQTYRGARHGLELWATILVPSLLPFFIISDIMFKIGVVQMFGVLLEPVMRPLFNLPGAASFVVAMGFTSGFPMGAVLTKRLCAEKQCTISEGERLVAFTNNASPLFILVAVAVGMFHHPSLGVILAIAHYLSNIIIGIWLGLRSPRHTQDKKDPTSIIQKCRRTLLEAQKNCPPCGQLMSDAVKIGINNICLIGGFVVIFAIIVTLLKTTSLLTICAYPCKLFLYVTGLAGELDTALATGFWEMTLGLNSVSLAGVTIRDQAIIAGILLGWSGLSIQAQVTGVLAGSGISPRLYYQSRVLQGILGGLITYVLTSHKDWLAMLTAPAFTSNPLPSSPVTLFFTNLLYTCSLFAVAMAVLLLLALFSLQTSRTGSNKRN
jgi:sporulation integral membrane protein YlbJ